METRLRLGKRFEVLERIGKGGMGVVYRVKDRLSDEELALKSLLLEAQSSEHGMEQRLQLANEFKWLSSLRHPNIVSVIDYGFDLIAQPFFTMELLQGYSNIVDACHLKPLHERLAVLGSVLHALAYLHRRDVIHRDLKSSNVLVKDGQIKLLDFGLVAVRGQEIDQNTVVGTLAYMAPEAILSSSPPSVSSDLYSFGVLAFYVLTGRLPFDKPEALELIQDILHSPVDFSGCILPEDLQLVLARLLLKNPEQRYDSAHEVIQVLNRVGASVPLETQQIRESYLKAAAFIGREQEWEQLKTALLSLGGSKGSSWLLGGETGIGKSRLIQELRSFALTRGYLILSAEASPQNRSPYNLWRNILRRLRLEVTLEEREQALVESILLGAENPLEHILERLIHLLVKQLLQQDAVLLILEDIHWGDEASLELLRQLLLRLEHLPVMLLASYRHDEASQLGKDLKFTEEILLERFQLHEIESLIQAILGRKAQPLAERLMQETEGNLYFLVEVLRTLAEKAGTLNEIGQLAWQGGVVTGGIRGIIENRINRIPKKHLRTLEMAALLGRRVDRSLVACLAPETEDFFRLAESAAILEIVNNEWQFSHNKLREILEERILPAYKRELHQRILLALEDLYGATAAAELAYHAQQAQDSARELTYSRIAADAAFKIFSLKDAIRYYQRTLQLSSQQVALAEDIAELYEQLGRSLELANLYDQAEAIYQKEYELGLSHSLPSVEVNALSNLACLYSNPNPLFSERNGRQSIHNGLVLGEKLGNRRELARLCWASMLSNIYSDGNSLRAVDDGLRALHLSRGLADSRLTAQVLHELSRAYLFEADFARGRSLMEKASQIWKSLDQLPMLVDAYGTLAVLHTFMGSYATALSFSRKAYELADEIDSSWGRSIALTYVGTILMEQSRPSAAIAVLEQCLRQGETAGNQLALVLSRSELALVYLRQGNSPKALETANRALQIANQHPQYHMLELSPKAVLAYSQMMSGEIEEARETLDSISPPEFSFLMAPSALYLIAETRAQLAILSEEFERALKIAESFLDVSQRLGLGSQLALAHSLLARILNFMDKDREALRHHNNAENARSSRKVPAAVLAQYLSFLALPVDP